MTAPGNLLFIKNLKVFLMEHSMAGSAEKAAE